MNENYDRVVKELEGLKAERDSLAKRVHTLNYELKAHQKKLHLMKNSRSWRVTRPLRVSMQGKNKVLVAVIYVSWRVMRVVGRKVRFVAALQQVMSDQFPRLRALAERGDSNRNGTVIARQIQSVPTLLTNREQQVLDALRREQL